MDLSIKKGQKDGDYSLLLNRGDLAIDKLDFSSNLHFDDLLIYSVDKILKRNKIDIQSVNRVYVDKHIDKNTSAFKMIAAFTSALNIAVNRP